LVVVAESACRVEVVSWSEIFVNEWAGCPTRVEGTLSLITGLPPSIGMPLDLGGGDSGEVELPVFLKGVVSISKINE
jgi:hypothetical protein